MSEQLNDLFANSPCLTRSEMMAYLQGKLMGTALRQVELHLADCEFCTDALEGLKKLNAGEVNEILARADARITKALQPPGETRSFVKRLLAVAAITVLLITTSFFLNYYFNTHKQNIAQKMEMPMPAVKQTDTATLRPLRETSGNDSVRGGSYAVTTSAPANGLVATGHLKNAEKAIAVTANHSSNEGEQKPVTYSLGSSKEEGNKVSQAVVPPVPAPNAKKDIARDSIFLPVYSNADKADKVMPENRKSIYAEKAETSSRSRDDGRTEIQFKKSDTINKKDAEANYYAGLNELKLKNYNKALNCFNNVLSDKGNAFYQQAQWQKANMFLQMGNNKDAQTLLTQIQQQNGMYKDSASQKLNELK